MGAAAATSLAALTVLGAAAAKRQTARKALRHELAVAYEEGCGRGWRTTFVFAMNFGGLDGRRYLPYPSVRFDIVI